MTTEIEQIDKYENDWEMQCPNCGSTQISIQIKVWVRLFPDGSEVQDGDHEWQSDSPAVCIDCPFEGKVSNFENAYHDNKNRN